MLGVIVLLKLPTILILAWAFRHPEESLRPGKRFWWVLSVAAVHLLLAVISLTGEKSSLAEMFRLSRLWALPGSVTSAILRGVQSV